MLAAAELDEPASQGRHAAAPEAANYPAKHETQSAYDVAAVFGLAVPAPQSVQEAAAARL